MANRHWNLSDFRRARKLSNWKWPLLLRLTSARLVLHVSSFLVNINDWRFPLWRQGSNQSISSCAGYFLIVYLLVIQPCLVTLNLSSHWQKNKIPLPILGDQNYILHCIPIYGWKHTYLTAYLSHCIPISLHRGDWGEVGHYSVVNFKNSYKIGYFSFA